MSKIPKAAVITRTKDRGILLERAIKSVHQQTMTDFIHVIINDGGDKKVVDNLIEKYKDITKGRIKVIHNDVSSGMEAASNKAIKSTDSIYVAVHDDDDSWHPDFLLESINTLEKNNAYGCISRIRVVYELIENDAVEELGGADWDKLIENANGIKLDFYRLYDLMLFNFAVPISFLYRRSVYDDIGFYDESLAVCGDWDFAIRFMCKFDIIPLERQDVYAYYHQRPDTRGVYSNSIFDGEKTHERYRSMIANKWLREDISEGKAGVGLLFNQRQAEYLNKNVIISTIKGLHVQLSAVQEEFILGKKSQLQPTVEMSQSHFNKIVSYAKKMKRKVGGAIKRL